MKRHPRDEEMGKETSKQLEWNTPARAAGKMILYSLTMCVVFSLVSVAHAGFPAADWFKVNEDGFVSGFDPSSMGTNLFVFDEKLYALNDKGFFRMNNPITRSWTKLAPPAPPSGPGSTPNAMQVFGDYLYAWDNAQLWWVKKGNDPNGTNGTNWNQVTSSGPPGGASPFPMTMFSSNIYGVDYTAGGAFEIWRTANIGATSATWTRVVMNSFGDTTNNQGVDIMTVFNGHVYVGVSTLSGSFGDPSSYGTGAEIWESSTGNSGSWSHVNTDGFGTLHSGCVFGTCNFAIHQVIGSAAVYQPSGAIQEYLYVGTKSHYGAEIWRYDGSGVSGWTNVTPSWAGPCPLGCGPGRNEAMTVFNGELYVAEGYPTANLAKYNGTSWSIVVNGPNPFNLNNTRLSSLAVYKNKIYTDAGWPAGTQGDQVWAYPFDMPKPDVKANGLDGPNVIVSPTTLVSLTIGLDPGEWVNQNGDWWIVIWAPWDLYSLVWPTGWTAGIVPLVQFPFFTINPPAEFVQGKFPVGTFLVIFGVDNIPDGVLNGVIWWDLVTVISQN